MNMRSDDGMLVLRAQQGDGTAIGELFSRYWRAARAAAFGVTGELSSAEDAAAEGLRQAWAGLASLRDTDRFGPWLRTIVVRQARQALRDRPAPDPSLDQRPDPGESPDRALERLELAVLIQQLVRELPPRLREAVSLYYFEGYDSDEAARFLEIPASTLRRRLLEGRRHLRAAADRVLEGRSGMNEERARQIDRLKGLIGKGDGGDGESLYQALRATLALRPVPHELIGSVIRSTAAAGDGTEFTKLVREGARRFAGPSDRASDPNHPVGSVAARIRRVLPDFQEWLLDAGEAGARFLTFTGEPRDRLRAVLPPGFAEGRPGAFLRTTRALLFPGERGPDRTSYQLLQECASLDVFRAAMNGVRMSDVLDLTWMVEGPLELRSVQQLLERLGAEVLPGVPIRFTHYEEPRYRSALKLQLADHAAAAATGGVLGEWPGRPEHVGAAHLRIFLEAWAAIPPV
jgi:RNA polymerase sigma factor (sigma-70 family)